MSKSGFTQVTQERLAELREAWNLVADKKTALTSKEVYRVYRALGFAPTELEHRTMFQAMEPKHDKVEFADFQHVMEDVLEKSIQPEKLEEAFELFDWDRKQYFDANDLQRVMTGLGEKLNKDQIRDMILEIDCQGDLRINREEFQDMMAL
mmetsp:Transcript_8512/g.21872  ORF Transcript_8512/g.21872 Transcript_8512/m.21872 type:complete len:151 (+) Transcript_8512:64-516(+)|eukprot:CAMPEP_0197427228 /NCGR_PEP_ID=MMETSP1170-20131217/37640_1 /TAXON_ID=54406 /ORGANISM="Sarcinochrysis sp, Strain CCMP770" /LENGTH=150 /DNA_ID=CAMNT_0042954909 /DNA_START=64 /DNA_END=516 /DNA_ORIENTATION=+